MKMWAMSCRATQDRQVIAGSSDKTWSTRGGNGKPPQYTCLENLMNSIKGWNDKSVDSLLINKTGESHGLSLLRLDFENTMLLSRIYFFLSPPSYLVFSFSQFPFLPPSLSLSLSLFFSPSLLWGNQLPSCEHSPVQGTTGQECSIPSQHPQETGGLPTATWAYWGPAPPLSGPEMTSPRADTSTVASRDTRARSTQLSIGFTVLTC